MSDEQITDMLAQVQRTAHPHDALDRHAAGCSACLASRVIDLLRERERLWNERDRLWAERHATERFISHIEALCEHGCREDAAYCPEGVGLLEAWGKARMTSEKPA